jgi:hypothetical protein
VKSGAKGAAKEEWRPSGGVEGDRLTLRTGSDPEAALAALAEATAEWDGEWEREGTGGRLALPVQGGLRHGVVQVQASAHAVAGGSELVLRTERADWHLRRSATLLLLVALLGAIAATLWPFVPALQSLPPLGLVLAVAAWLAVLTRLRHRSVREFLDDVETKLEPSEGAGERSEP